MLLYVVTNLCLWTWLVWGNQDVKQAGHSFTGLPDINVGTYLEGKNSVLNLCRLILDLKC